MAQYQLNLVLHGTWGIEENDKLIRLVTIADHHHVIQAGDRDDPIHNLSGEYTLYGATPGTSPGFRRDQNPVVDNRTADPGKAAVVINVPNPREIHSVRRFKTNGVQFFETDTPSVQDEMSAAQVLVYDVEKLEDLKLDGCPDWKPEVVEALDEYGGLQKVVNLHVSASPRMEMGVPAKHFIEVFQSLAAAFGFVITPLESTRPGPVSPLNRDMTPTKMTNAPPNLEERVTGLSWRDTIELHELRPRPAASPINCDMVVFKNRPGG